jgi:hypothetical protein
VKPRYIRKEYQLQIDLTFDNRLQKPTAKMNPATWITAKHAWITVVL